MPDIAALTGDLVNSTEASPAAVDAAMASIAATAGPGGTFARFRGDGWQIYEPEAGRALWTAFLIAAKLAAAPDLPQSRIAIALGTAELPPDGALNAARGSAFLKSGRALDAMQPGQILALAGETAMASAMLALAEDRILRWSREQAEAMSLALAGQSSGGITRADIAARLGISRQAVDSRLKAAGHDLILRAAHAFRTDVEART